MKKHTRAIKFEAFAEDFFSYSSNFLFCFYAFKFVALFGYCVVGALRELSRKHLFILLGVRGSFLQINNKKRIIDVMLQYRTHLINHAEIVVACLVNSLCCASFYFLYAFYF